MGILVRNNKVISAGGKILYSRVGNPFELPNLKLYLSATRMVQQADESSVSSFTDFTGNSFHATQGTSGFRPKFDLNQFGSNAGIKFDGTDDVLTIPNGLSLFRNWDQYTVQCLVKRGRLSQQETFLNFIRNNGTSIRFHIYITPTGLRCSFRKTDGGAYTSTLEYASNDLNPHLVQVTLNPTNWSVYFYVDGVFVSQTPMESSGYTDNTDLYAAEIGKYTAGSAHSNISVNGVSINQSYSDPATIQAQYRGYLQRGYL